MDLKIAIQENNVQKAEEIIKMELVNNPLDIQWWIKLSLTELQFPFEDYVSALDCIEKIKKITDNNVDALILETGIKWHNFGFIEDELLERLSSVDIEDAYKMSIIYYLQSLYYRYKKEIKDEKKMLNKSIALHDKFVYPYKALGHIAKVQLCVKESKILFLKAFNNIQKIYSDEELYDFTDFNVYVSEFITGVYISKANYENLKALIA
ncbi:hypothetical protein [Clostridium sp. AN503]|uniref:hypothetical protein n=1 Tax=Clostridium sp. AN503 TaxID=3160598 RepID=UPI0034580E5E